MRRTSRILSTFTGFAILCATVSSARAAYIVTDIATLNYQFPQVLAINNSGQVAFTNGFGNTAFPPAHAYLYSGGKITDLGGPYYMAGGLNDAGQVAGFAGQAALFSGGTVKELGVLPPSTPYSSSSATGINSAGQIVGSSNNKPFSAGGDYSHAFLYAHGVMKDLGVLTGKIGGQAVTASFATAINAPGQVVGYSGWYNLEAFTNAAHAFLYSNGTMKDLGVLGKYSHNGFSYENSEATAINTAGQVVGSSTTGSASSHAFLYSGGVMKDLGVLGVFKSTLFGIQNFSQANGINSQGQIVGTTSTTTGASAFLYQNGKMQDINTLLAPGTRFQIYAADGINDKGQIVAFAYDGRHTHVVELTPQGQVAAAPEPGSFALGLLGMSTLLGCRYRRGRLAA